MRRLLMFMIALSIGYCSFAASTYTTKIKGDVTVTDKSAGQKNKFILEFEQTGHNTSDGKDYVSNVCLILYPEKASIAGSFSIADGSINPDSYIDEGQKKDFSVDVADIRATDFRSTDGYIDLDLNSEKAECVALAFYTDEFSIPAGTYQVSASGANGTIKVSKGMDGYYPDMSYFMSSSFDNYFITLCRTSTSILM